MSAKNILAGIIKLGNKIDKRDTTFCLAKLLEESGEFAQAALAYSGFTSKKKLKHKNHIYEEACDAIIMILDTLGKAHRDQLNDSKITEHEIIDRVFAQFPIKLKKWERVVKAKQNSK